MNEYLCMCIYICMHVSMRAGTQFHESVNLYIYVAEVNINTAGMSIFLLPMEFYILVGKYLHYSTFDDIITLHH